MSNGRLSAFLGEWLPRIEEEIRSHLDIDDETMSAYYGMMKYHLGWVDRELRPVRGPEGKRLRPILCLLACTEVGGDPVQALPAAAAIELLHNFSLIHDDVEDGDAVRHHRATVWKVWGVAQAINVGDGMYTLAYTAMQRLARRGVAHQTTLAALEHFTQTNLALTEGQYLDLSFEERTDVSIEQYMRMIQGKTAVLIGAGTTIGALIGQASQSQQTGLLQFGQSLGLTFQIQDDILGIWSDPAQTGKSASNDLIRRKKTLPVIYTLNHPTVGAEMKDQFARPGEETDIPAILSLMQKAGAHEYARTEMRKHYDLGFAALASALGDRASESLLGALAASLLDRSV